MRLGRLSISIGTFAIGVVLCFLLLSGFALVARAGLWNRFAGYLTGRSTSIDVSSPSVVEKIHQLSRLETVVYSLDKIVEGERQSAYLPDFLATASLLENEGASRMVPDLVAVIGSGGNPEQQIRVTGGEDGMLGLAVHQYRGDLHAELTDHLVECRQIDVMSRARSEHAGDVG